MTPVALAAFPTSPSIKERRDSKRHQVGQHLGVNLGECCPRCGARAGRRYRSSAPLRHDRGRRL